MCRLVPYTTPVDSDPSLSPVEPDEILCDVVPKIQVDRRDLTACCLDSRSVRHDSPLITIEEWQIDVQSKGRVVERLTYRSKIPRGIESQLRETTVRALITAEYAGVRSCRCLV